MTGEGDVEIGFNPSAMATAMALGGPMGRGSGQSRSGNGTTVPRGEDGALQLKGDHLPNSSGLMASAIGKELSQEKCTENRHDSNATDEKSSGEVV
jgi:hypothetical protein